jgi:hypothetical protein
MIWSSANRPHATQRRANARADKRRLRQRGVANAFLAELGQQTTAHGETAAVMPHVLAHQKHAWIALHRGANALAHRVAKRHLPCWFDRAHDAFTSE